MFLRMSLVLSISYCSGYEIGTKNMLNPPEPYALVVWIYYVVSWPIFVLFRYYFLVLFHLLFDANSLDKIYVVERTDLYRNPLKLPSQSVPISNQPIH